MAWRYLHEREVLTTMQNTRRSVRATSVAIARHPATPPSLARLVSIFDEFDPNYWEAAARHARDWLEESINIATREYMRAINSGTAPLNAGSVVNELVLMTRDMQYIATLPRP